jgi:hypothetical protein
LVAPGPPEMHFFCSSAGYAVDVVARPHKGAVALRSVTSMGSEGQCPALLQNCLPAYDQ